MPRYIDADIGISQLKEDLSRMYNNKNVKPEDIRAVKFAMFMLNKIPTADVKPVVFGKWVECGEVIGNIHDDPELLGGNTNG